MELKFVKMHGCAADGILIDCAEESVSTSLAAANAPWMCCRRTGVGADFVALIHADAHADARVQAFGPSGRELLVAADAVRLAAEYLFASGRVRAGVARIAVSSGVLTAVRNAHGLITVALGRPEMETSKMPLPGCGRVLDKLVEAGGEACVVSCVGVGGPYCVMFRHTGGIDIDELGQRCRRSTFFRGGEGLVVAELLGEKRLRARAWRYQMGEVPALSECAAAAVAAAVQTGRCREGADVAVEMPGGTLIVRCAPEGVFITGEAVRVFEGAVTIGDA